MASLTDILDFSQFIGSVGVSAEEAGRSLAKLTEILKGNGSVDEAISTIEGDSSLKVYAVIRK
jgi:hypothetical protein